MPDFQKNYKTQCYFCSGSDNVIYSPSYELAFHVNCARIESEKELPPRKSEDYDISSVYKTLATNLLIKHPEENYTAGP